MKIDILTKNVEMTSAIRSYAEKKIGSLALFVKRFEKDGEVEIFLEVARTTKHHKHGEVFYAEATLNLSGKTIRAEKYNINLYDAINGLKQMLKNDIIKYKSKLTDTKIRGKAAKK